jgi:hypothetical protein
MKTFGTSFVHIACLIFTTLVILALLLPSMASAHADDNGNRPPIARSLSSTNSAGADDNGNR